MNKANDDNTISIDHPRPQSDEQLESEDSIDSKATRTGPSGQTQQTESVHADVDVDVVDVHAKEESNPTEAEERHIRSRRLSTTQDATTKLESALTRIRDVTSTLLSEMNAYLEAAESVEVAYVRCEYSQRKESKRLEDVAPDINGTTSSLSLGL